MSRLNPRKNRDKILEFVTDNARFDDDEECAEEYRYSVTFLAETFWSHCTQDLVEQCVDYNLEHPEKKMEDYHEGYFKDEPVDSAVLRGEVDYDLVHLEKQVQMAQAEVDEKIAKLNALLEENNLI
jgi:hypothetical protein